MKIDEFYTLITPHKNIEDSDMSKIFSISHHYPWFGVCRLMILKYKQQTKANDFSQYFAFTILSVDNQNIDEWIEEDPRLMTNNKL